MDWRSVAIKHVRNMPVMRATCRYYCNSAIGYGNTVSGLWNCAIPASIVVTVVVSPSCYAVWRDTTIFTFDPTNNEHHHEMFSVDARKYTLGLVSLLECARHDLRDWNDMCASTTK